MKSRLDTLFNKQHIRETLLNLSFILLLCSLAFQLVQHLFKDYGYDSFIMSEFLINYQAGFVRRGLTGEILYFFVKNFDIDFKWTVKIVCLIWFGVACALFVKGFIKKGYSLYILPTFLFLGSGITHETWIRKDYLFFCVLIPIFCVFGKNELNKATKFLIVNSLSVVTILIHESFVFFSLPFLFLLILNEYWEKGFFRSTAAGLTFLSPSIGAFFLILYHRGDLQMAQTIYNSWLPVMNDLNALKIKLNDFDIISLSAIGWETTWAFWFHIKYNFGTIDMGMSSIFFWFMLYILIYYIASNILLVFRKTEDTFTDKDKTILSSVLLFQFVCLIPLFTILSCDLGRVIFYWIASSFAIFLWIAKSKIEKMFPLFLFYFAENINNFLSNVVRPTKTIIVLLLMFIGTKYYIFSPAHIFEKSMIGHIIFILSQPLVLLKSFILGRL